MNRKQLLTICLSGVVVVGVIVGLFVAGKLTWNNVAHHPVTSAVCGTNIVNKYNGAMYMIERGGSSEPSIDEVGVAAVKNEVRAKAGYKDDATCQTLLFWIAMHDSDYPAAKSAYGVVKQLHDGGVFADNNIRGNDALFNYGTVLRGIAPETKGLNSASH